MKITDRFTFGYYFGKTVQEVWFGESFDWDKIYHIQNTLIHEITDYLSQKEEDYSIPLRLSHYPDLERDLNLIHNVDFTYADNLIITKNNRSKITLIIRKLLRRVFEHDLIHFHKNFNQLKIKTKKEYREEIYSANTHDLFSMLPNPYYIYWAIENVDKFRLDTGEMEKLKEMPQRYLSSFKFRVIPPKVLQCVPIYKTLNIQNFEEISSLNENKKIINRTKRRNSAHNTGWYENKYKDPRITNNYCEACQQTPCMCSDPY
jgi:hypothetical protein